MNSYKRAVIAKAAIAASILTLILIAGIVGYHVSPKQSMSFGGENSRYYASEGSYYTGESFGSPCVAGCHEPSVVVCDCKSFDTGSSRPSFGGPMRVMSPAEINKGYFIKVSNRPCGTYQKLIKVMKEPYLYCSGDGQGPGHCDLVVDAVACDDNYLPKLYEDGTPHIIDREYLTDMGVIPYDTGQWNQKNALLRVDPSELPDSLTEKFVNID